MPDSFILTLDRQTQVGVAINGGSPQTDLDTVTLELALDDDAVQIKVWGDINPLDPANSEYGETEEDAPWITPSPSLLVNLTTNPGQKRLSARVRDDVDNEAVGSATILFGEEVVPPARPPSQRPKPVPGKPTPPRPEPELREVRVRSAGVALTTSAAVAVRVASRHRGVTLLASPALIRGRAGTSSSRIQLSTSVQSYIKTDVKGTRRIQIGAEPAVLAKSADPVLLALLLDGEL